MDKFCLFLAAQSSGKLRPRCIKTKKVPARNIVSGMKRVTGSEKFTRGVARVFEQFFILGTNGLRSVGRLKNSGVELPPRVSRRIRMKNVKIMLSTLAQWENTRTKTGEFRFVCWWDGFSVRTGSTELRNLHPWRKSKMENTWKDVWRSLLTI